MTILNKFDRFKRRYIEALLETDKVVKINDKEYTFENNRSLVFYKNEFGYIFNSDNYFSTVDVGHDPEVFISMLKKDIEYQIENLENIQKILWGCQQLQIIYKNL